MKEHFWSLDCIAICTVLGFTMDDEQIDRLCRKHNLYTGKDPLDTSYGFYLVHQVAYAAFRDARRKTTAVEKDADALAAVQRDLRQSRKRFAQQKTEGENLYKRLAEAERNMTALRATRERQQQRISELEERPDQEGRLRRRIRILEHELAQRRQEGCPSPVRTRGKSNEKEEPSNQSLDVVATRCSRTDAGLQLDDPTTPPGAICLPCPLDALRVAVVGGQDRLEPRYRRVVESLGARFSFHNGDCHGGCQVLKNVVCQSDIIVFITRLNSHSALQVVRGLCRKSGKRFTVLRETSPQSLAKALQGAA